MCQQTLKMFGAPPVYTVLCTLSPVYSCVVCLCEGAVYTTPALAPQRELQDSLSRPCINWVLCTLSRCDFCCSGANATPIFAHRPCSSNTKQHSVLLTLHLVHCGCMFGSRNYVYHGCNNDSVDCITHMCITHDAYLTCMQAGTPCCLTACRLTPLDAYMHTG